MPVSRFVLFLPFLLRPSSFKNTSVRPSISLSVCLSHHFFTMFLSTYHHEIFRSYYHWHKWCPSKRSRLQARGQGSRCQNTICPNLVVSRSWLQFKFTDGYEMMHKCWSSTEKLPYCFLGHPSNFKVTRDTNLPIFTRIEQFRIVTPVWIH